MKTVQPVLNWDMIENEWGTFAPFFSKLVSPQLNLEDIYSFLHAGTWTLWVTRQHNEINSVAVTAFIHYPRYTALRIILTSGGNTDWPEGTSELEDFASANGCSAVEVMGRKGWERVLAERGFEFQHITLTKRLTDVPQGYS